MKGWYHTGTGSFKNPEIREFKSADVPLEFGFGPFATFKLAKADFLDLVKSDIGLLKTLLTNIKRL